MSPDCQKDENHKNLENIRITTNQEPEMFQVNLILIYY